MGNPSHTASPIQIYGSPSPTASPIAINGEPQPHSQPHRCQWSAPAPQRPHRDVWEPQPHIELLPHRAPHSRAPQPHRSPSPPPPHGAAPLWGLHGTRWGRIPPHIHRGRGAAGPCGGLWGIMGIYGALWGSERLYGAAPQLLTAPHGVGGLRSTETCGAERHRKGRSHGADTAKRRGEPRGQSGVSDHRDRETERRPRSSGAPHWGDGVRRGGRGLCRGAGLVGKGRGL